MSVSLDTDDAFVANHREGRLRYDTVDWQAFATHLYFDIRRQRSSTGAIIVPAHRNISNDDIDDYANVLQKSIQATILAQTKRTRSSTGSDKFVNWRIKLLKRRKNEVIRRLFDTKKWPQQISSAELRSLKTELRLLQTLITDWQTVISELSHRDPRAGYPSITC